MYQMQDERRTVHALPRNSNLRVCCRLLTRVVDKHAHVVIHAQWLDRQNNLRQSTIDDYVIDS